MSPATLSNSCSAISPCVCGRHTDIGSEFIKHHVQLFLSNDYRSCTAERRACSHAEPRSGICSNGGAKSTLSKEAPRGKAETGSLPAPPPTPQTKAEIFSLISLGIPSAALPGRMGRGYAPLPKPHLRQGAACIHSCTPKDACNPPPICVTSGASIFDASIAKLDIQIYFMYARVHGLKEAALSSVGCVWRLDADCYRVHFVFFCPQRCIVDSLRAMLECHVVVRSLFRPFFRVGYTTD